MVRRAASVASDTSGWRSTRVGPCEGRPEAEKDPDPEEGIPQIFLRVMLEGKQDHTRVNRLSWGCAHVTHT